MISQEEKMSKKKKLTPRANFVLNAPVAHIAARAWDALMLASSHDPDHHSWLKELEKIMNRDLQRIEDRLDIVEHQLRRIGAPQYRRARKNVLCEIVRGPKSAKKVKDYTL